MLEGPEYALVVAEQGPDLISIAVPQGTYEVCYGHLSGAVDTH